MVQIFSSDSGRYSFESLLMDGYTFNVADWIMSASEVNYYTFLKMYIDHLVVFVNRRIRSQFFINIKRKNADPGIPSMLYTAHALFQNFKSRALETERPWNPSSASIPQLVKFGFDLKISIGLCKWKYFSNINCVRNLRNWTKQYWSYGIIYILIVLAGQQRLISV